MNLSVSNIKQEIVNHVEMNNNIFLLHNDDYITLSNGKTYEIKSRKVYKHFGGENEEVKNVWKADREATGMGDKIKRFFAWVFRRRTSTKLTAIIREDKFRTIMSDIEKYSVGSNQNQRLRETAIEDLKEYFGITKEK